eukprot:766979-Hanusia_phi.AAC.5
MASHLSDLSHEGSHFFSVHHLALQQSLAEDLFVVSPTQAGFPKVASQEEESVDGLLAIDLEKEVRDPDAVSPPRPAHCQGSAGCPRSAELLARGQESSPRRVCRAC